MSEPQRDVQQDRFCEWTDDLGIYVTSCGHMFELNHGTPAQNGMKFCCYCGKELRAPDAQKARE